MEMSSSVNRPRWVDLATHDPEAAQQFYGQLFGWRMEVSEDPRYGGYAMAMLGDGAAAGIGGKQDANSPNVWALYIGSDDLENLSERVTAEGGTVVVPSFEVGDQGRMAVFRDPSGAFISGWHGTGGGNFTTDEPGAFSWAELNARGVDNVLPFYERVFGWTVRTTDGGDQPYHEFELDGETILGALEMPSMMPAEVQPYWLVYFDVEEVDAAAARATELGATQLVAPEDFPGGRYAVLNDPQGAVFAVLKVTQDV
jgi:hypothetical protein